jgi:hypothetical protein
MARPNADRARDPDAGGRFDPRADPSSSREASMVDIPLAPATIANMKLADPYCTIGSRGDDAGILDGAVREGNSEINDY